MDQISIRLTIFYMSFQTSKSEENTFYKWVYNKINGTLVYFSPFFLLSPFPSLFSFSSSFISLSSLSFTSLLLSHFFVYFCCVVSLCSFFNFHRHFFISFSFLLHVSFLLIVLIIFSLILSKINLQNHSPITRGFLMCIKLVKRSSSMFFYSKQSHCNLFDWELRIILDVAADPSLV